jgi:hypothetical protein
VFEFPHSFDVATLYSIHSAPFRCVILCLKIPIFVDWRINVKLKVVSVLNKIPRHEDMSCLIKHGAVMTYWGS